MTHEHVQREPKAFTSWAHSHRSLTAVEDKCERQSCLFQTLNKTKTALFNLQLGAEAEFLALSLKGAGLQEGGVSSFSVFMLSSCARLSCLTDC